MQLLIVFAAVCAASFSSPIGEINQAVQTSNAAAGLLGTGISSGNALPGGDAGRGVEGLGLGAIIKPQQASNALAGDNGIAVASGTAMAGNRRVKRVADERSKNATDTGKKRVPSPKVKRAVAMIVGGPKAGEFVAV